MASLCSSTDAALASKNQTGKGCAGLIHLNSIAGHLEKDEGGTGEIGAIAGCVIRQQKANKASVSSIKRLWPPRQKRSSLIVKITGAPMRDMIHWIIGADESLLDVAIDGLVAIFGSLFLMEVLHVVIERLEFFDGSVFRPYFFFRSSHRRVIE